MKTENKKITVDYGSRVIVIPARAAERFGDATKEDILALISLLSDPDAPALCDEEQMATSIAFWKGAGIISDGEITEKSKPKKKKRVAAETPSYTMDEISEMIEKDDSISAMIDECERLLGKMFRSADTQKLISLKNYLGVDAEYLLSLCSHCGKIGKTSMRYVETTAMDLFDRGITDSHTLDEHFRAVEASLAIEGKIRKLFGINLDRSLTAKEKKFIDDWTGKLGYGYEIIKMAYEITVDKINAPSLAYANAILLNWKDANLNTPEEIAAYLETSAKAADEVSAAAKSFDTDDFFAAALSRSYESAKKPDLPPKKTHKK